MQSNLGERGKDEFACSIKERTTTTTLDFKQITNDGTSIDLSTPLNIETKVYELKLNQS